MPDVGRPARPEDEALGVAARHRAEIALAGRRGEFDTATAGLRDPRPAVRVGALRVLARYNLVTVPILETLQVDRDPMVRRSTCELAASLPVVPWRGLLGDEDPGVVEAAAFAVGEVGEAEALDALVGLARGHADPLCRESAVAALGALGDERGLGAILDALSDRPAVRRRAVLALAGFEGEAVDEALQRASADRDFQVRQAAEDLLGPDRCLPDSAWTASNGSRPRESAGGN